MNIYFANKKKETPYFCSFYLISKTNGTFSPKKTINKKGMATTRNANYLVGT